MKFNKIINTAIATLKRNSPILLSSAAITGVVSTAYLAGKASFEAVRAIDRAQYRENLSEKSHPFDNKEKAQIVWKLYIPAAASGAMTIVCIVGTAKVGNKRAMAAQAAFVLTERAYAEYREKVVEEFGEKKDEAIRARIAEDRIRATPPPSQQILITGPGNVLCCELHTGRYFASDMETLKKAENNLNAMLLRQDTASLAEWYHLIGLGPTTNDDDLGWHSDKLMELNFSTVLSEDGRPCLAFDYNYFRPLYGDFHR